MKRVVIRNGITKVFSNHKIVNSHYSTISDKKHYSDKGFTVIVATR